MIAAGSPPRQTTQEPHRGPDLLVREDDAVRRVPDVRMHLPPVDERVALDPRQDLAVLIVHPQPTRRGLESCLLQMEKNVADS